MLCCHTFFITHSFLGHDDCGMLLGDLASQTPAHMRGLNEAICGLIQDYSMVSFLPMDITDEDSVELVLSHIDSTIQYGEDLEPNTGDGQEEQEQDDF